MAALKISQLPTVLNAAVGANSVLPIVDSVDSATKKIALSQLDLRWSPIGAISSLTGDVTASGPGAAAATIAANAVSNAKAAQMPALTMKGNNGVATANASDLTIPQLRTMMSVIPVTTKMTASGTYNLPYAFFITSGSATVGATYTNNGVTFTVVRTVASGTQLLASGNNVPATSGTLTKSGGTGDATLTFHAFLPPKYIDFMLIGGGGGGASGGGSAAAAGNATNSTIDVTLAIANGGNGGPGGGGAGARGSYSLDSSVIDLGSMDGTPGGASTNAGWSANFPGSLNGGNGGSSVLGGGGQSAPGGAGSNAAANSGSGGGGGGMSTTTGPAGGGGGSGGCARGRLVSLNATYAVVIGAGSAGNTAGVFDGGNGADGVAFFTAYFN
jgi:hypothetical protein